MLLVVVLVLEVAAADAVLMIMTFSLSVYVIVDKRNSQINKTVKNTARFTRNDQVTKKYYLCTCTCSTILFVEHFV